MLQKLGFLPGFNKQVTSTGAESQWTDGENVAVAARENAAETPTVSSAEPDLPF